MQLTYTDRSRHVLGLRHCPFARYLRYHADKTGWVKRAANRDTTYGIALHEGLALHASGNNLDTCIDAGKSRLRRDLPPPTQDLENLLEGHLYVFTIGTIYSGPIMGIEREIGFTTHDHIRVQAKPDLIVEGVLGPVVIDYKTTSALDDRFWNQWQFEPQIMLNLYAASKLFGKTIDKFQVVGFNKGPYKGTWNPSTRKEEGDPWQQSILCYGYRCKGNPPLSQDSWEPELWTRTKTGNRSRKIDSSYIRTPTNEFPGGTRAWIDWLKENHPLSFRNIIESRAIFPYVKDLESYIESFLAHEREWRDKLEALSKGKEPETLFAKSFNCHSYYGKTCDYLEPCLKGQPLTLSTFINRTPHHQEELDSLVGTVKQK